MEWIKDHFSSRSILGLASIIIILIGSTALRFSSVLQRFNIGEDETLRFLFQRYTAIEVASLLLVTGAVGLTWFFVVRPISDVLKQQVHELEVNQVLLEEQNKIFIEQNQYLSKAIEITRQLAPIQNRDELIKLAVESIKEAYRLYHAQIYLKEGNNRTLLLQVGSGDVGQELVRKGHRLLIGSGSISGTAAQRNETILVPDTKLSKLFVPNPLLPDTKSAMSIPLSIEDNVLGILNLQSDQIHGLNRSIQYAIEGMAGQLAAAIQTANRFIELEEAQNLVNEQNAASLEMGWKDFQSILDRGEDLVYHYKHKRNRATSTANGADGATEVQPLLMAASVLSSGFEIGSIQIESEQNQTLGDADVELLNSIADQLGRKIENLRLFSEAQHYREQAEIALRQDVRQKWSELGHQQKRNGYLFEGNNVLPIPIEEGDETGLNGAYPHISETSQPIKIKGESVGEIIIAGDDNEAEIENLIESVAESLSLHLENLRLSEQTERRVWELSLLNNVNRIVTSGLEFSTLLEELGDTIRMAFDAVATFVALYNEESNSISFPYYVIDKDGELTHQNISDKPYGSGFTSIIIENRTPLLLNADIEKFLAQGANTLDTTEQREGNFSFLGAPLIARNQVLGVISIQNTPDKPLFDENDQNLLTAIANSSAVALLNSQLFSETQDALANSESRRRELQAINEIVSQAATAATFEESLASMTEQLIDLLQIDLITVSLYDAEEQTTKIIHERDHLGLVTNRLNQVDNLNQIPAQQEVIESQKPLLITDIDRSEMLGKQTGHLRETGASAQLLLPMLGLSGALGTVSLTLFGRSQGFMEDQMRLAETIVYQTSTVLENKQLLAETNARAMREQKVRNITDKIRRGSSREEILEIARKEIQGLISFSKNTSKV